MSDEKKTEETQPDRRRRGGPKKGRRKARGQQGQGGEGTLQRSHRIRSGTEVGDQEQSKG